MWLLLLFSLACPGFNFCRSNFPYVCLWCKEKGEHVFARQRGASQVLVEYGNSSVAWIHSVSSSDL